jgi:hypothetical protein
VSGVWSDLHGEGVAACGPGFIAHRRRGQRGCTRRGAAGSVRRLGRCVHGAPRHGAPPLRASTVSNRQPRGPPLPRPRAAGGWAPGALWQCPQQPRALVPPSVRRDVDMLESQSSRLRGTVGSWTLGSEAGPQPFFATLMQQKSRGKVVAAQRPEGRSLSGGILTRKMISGDLLEIYSTAKWDSRRCRLSGRGVMGACATRAVEWHGLGEAESGRTMLYIDLYFF